MRFASAYSFELFRVVIGAQKWIRRASTFSARSSSSLAASSSFLVKVFLLFVLGFGFSVVLLVLHRLVGVLFSVAVQLVGCGLCVRIEVMFVDLLQVFLWRRGSLKLGMVVPNCVCIVNSPGQ